MLAVRGWGRDGATLRLDLMDETWNYGPLEPQLQAIKALAMSPHLPEGFCAEVRAFARDLPSQLYPYGAYYYAYDAYTKEQIVRWVKGWT